MKPLRFAVLGDPVAHSKSPAMHAAAYRALGMPHTYEAVRATEGDLARLTSELRAGSWGGFNVTVPHKRRILEHVDAIDASASGVGAANTLVRTEDGRVIAHNTDVPALAEEVALLAPERTDWRRARALVLGTGGAARAAVVALVENLGVQAITVRGRRPQPFEDELRGLFATRNARVALDIEPWAPSREREPTLDIVVQATSAGMYGADPGEATKDAVAWDLISPEAVALEIVYAPPITPFLHAASAHGLRAANGLGMLVRQGALAFERWLGVAPPHASMLAALK